MVYFHTEKPRRPRGFFHAVNFLRKLQVMSTGIYTITSPTGKIYVGQSVDLASRRNHYSILQCKDQPRIYNSIKKHGWANHTFQVIMPLRDNTDQAILNWYEQFFIDYYRNEEIELLNIKEGGSHGKHTEETKEKMRGRFVSKETRQKMSVWQKGKKKSPEAIKKSADANRGKKRTEEQRAKLRGKVISQETRQKISIANKGKIISAETRAKMRAWQIGRKPSPQCIEKSRLANLGKKRGPMSDERKQKLSVALTGRTFSDETKAKMSEWQIGRKLTPEHIQNTQLGRQKSEKVKAANEKLRITMKGNTHTLGLKHSEESKIKIGNAIRGKKRSEETKRRMSLAQKNVKHYPTRKENKLKN